MPYHPDENQAIVFMLGFCLRSPCAVFLSAVKSGEGLG